MCKSVVSWLRVLDVWVSLVKQSESFKLSFFCKCDDVGSKTCQRELIVGRKEARSLMLL